MGERIPQNGRQVCPNFSEMGDKSVQNSPKWETVIVNFLKAGGGYPPLTPPARAATGRKDSVFSPCIDQKRSVNGIRFDRPGVTTK